MPTVKVPSVYTYRIYASGKSKDTIQAHEGWLFEYFRQSCSFYNKLLETYNSYFDERISAWRAYKKTLVGTNTEVDYSLSPYMSDKALYQATVPLEGFELLGAGAKSQLIRKLMRVMMVYFSKARKAIESGEAPSSPRKDGRFNNWPRFARLSDFCTVPIQLKAGVDFVDTFYNEAGDMTRARVKIGIGKNVRLYAVNYDRQLPKWTAQKPVLSLMRSTTNSMFFISVPMPENETEVRFPRTRKEVGIDMGLKHFITTNDGSTYDLFDRKTRGNLMKEWSDRATLVSNKPCHKLPRKDRSRSYWKAHAEYRNFEDRVKRIKTDRMYCLANELTKQYDTIYIGHIDLRSIMKKKPRKEVRVEKNRWMKARHKRAMRRNFAWSGMYAFIQILKHVALKNNKTVIEVDERYSTMRCSGCGEVVEKDLSIRTHHCPSCGLILDRDHNAAINMLEFGKLDDTERKTLNKLIERKRHSANLELTETAGRLAET